MYFFLSVYIVYIQKMTDVIIKTFSEVSPHLSRCFCCIESFSWPFSVDLAQNRQQECRSLSGTCGHRVILTHGSCYIRNDSAVWLRWHTLTCLRAGHEVSLGLDNRNGVFLDRGRSGVATQSNVAHDDLAQVHVLELRKWTQPRNDAVEAQRNMDGSLVGDGSLRSRCGGDSCVRWPPQECRRISQS